MRIVGIRRDGGDVVEVEVERLGVLTNTVVDNSARKG